MDILVSINCITYNHEPYIARAIESFLMQKTNFNFEILIGEDCSTDNTRKIVKEYADKYPNKLILITSEKNVGWKENARRLLEKSRGKYIAICEGDDFWLDPYKLQKQFDYMESHPDCTLCFHSAIIVNEKGKAIGKKFRPYSENTICSTEAIIEGGGEFCPTASLFYPKVLLKNIPEFILNAHVGDYPLQMWLSSLGYAYYMDDMMSAYRRGAIGSWTIQLSSGENRLDKNICAIKTDIKLLNEFNEYTNYKYNSAVENAKTRREFIMLIIQNNLDEIKRTKYKIFFEELNMIDKLKNYTRLYFTHFYKKIVNVKSKLNKLKWK